MQKIYITPYNKPAKALAEIFKSKSNINVLFIDSYKYDNITIFHPQSIKNEEIEQIIVISPNYYNAIYQILIENKIPKNKVYFYDSVCEKYFTSMFLYKSFLTFQKNRNKATLFFSSLKLKKYKNKHLNQRCFILGNGPSLTINDLNKLTNEVTFASNKIYLAFNETAWRPNYYFVEDYLVLKQNYETIKKLQGFEIFFPKIALEWVPKTTDGIYYNLIYDFNEAHFSDDPIKGLYWGATVTYSMIQMAIYMGFKEIYLLGVDFSFTNSSEKVNIGDTGIFLHKGEQNHFHKNYRKEGEQWTVPDMEFQKNSFIMAKKYAKIKNIVIYNSSRFTMLDTFKKKEFGLCF